MKRKIGAGGSGIGSRFCCCCCCFLFYYSLRTEKHCDAPLVRPDPRGERVCVVLSGISAAHVCVGACGTESGVGRQGRLARGSHLEVVIGALVFLLQVVVVVDGDGLELVLLLLLNTNALKRLAQGRMLLLLLPLLNMPNRGPVLGRTVTAAKAVTTCVGGEEDVQKRGGK